MSATFEIPFHVRSREAPKWISGVDEETRCSDVVSALIQGKKSVHKRLDPDDLVLVEQWRGVERVLDPEAKVLKLWRAWGEERAHVKFVLKRSIRRRRRTKSRRRNSTCSNLSDVHPNKFAAGDEPSEELNDQIEEMMRIILSQGRMICDGLKASSSSASSSSSSKATEFASKTTAHSFTQRSEEGAEQEYETMLAELSRLSDLNESLHAAETKCHILSSNLSQFDVPQQQQQQRQSLPKEEDDALTSLREDNERLQNDIARNQKVIDSMKEHLKSRRDSVKRLEYDVNVIEKEGRKLNRELEKVSRLEIPEDGNNRDGDDVEVIYTELRDLRIKCTAVHHQQAEAEDDDDDDDLLRIPSGTRLSPAESSTTSGVSSSGIVDKSEYFSAKIAQFEGATKRGGGVHSSTSMPGGGGVAGPRGEEEDSGHSDGGLSSLHSSSDEARNNHLLHARMTRSFVEIDESDEEDDDDDDDIGTLV